MCVCFQDLAGCNQIVEVYVKWLTIDDITSSILIIFNYMYNEYILEANRRTIV